MKQGGETLEVQSEPEVIPPPTEPYPLETPGNPVQGEDFYEPETGTVKGKVIMPATEDQSSITNISEPLLSEQPESFDGDERPDLGDDKVPEKVAPAEDFEDVPISKKDKKKRKKNKAIFTFDEGKAETSPQVEEPRGESRNGEQPSERGPTSESREGLDNLVEAEDFTMKRSKKKGKKGEKLFNFDFDDTKELSQEKGPQPNPSIEQPSEVPADIPLESEIGDTAPDIPAIEPEPAMVTFGQKPTPVQSSSNMPPAFEQAGEPAKPDTAQMDQEPEADDVREMPKSRKDKKKAKKSKLLSWDDMEDQLPTEPAPPTPPNLEEPQSLADKDSLQPFNNPPLADNDIPTEASKSKKDRKKAKKTRLMVWQEEDAVNSIDVEAPELLPTPPNDIIVPVSSTATDTVKDIPALSSIATADFENIESGSISKSKRDKKMAKKAKSPAREEDTTPDTARVLEPSTSLQDSTLTMSDAPREVTDDVSAATPDVPTASDEGQTFDTPKNKRDKKKAKKTKTSVGEDESGAKPGATEKFQEPVMPMEETFPAQSISLDVSMEENTTKATNAAAEDIADLSRGNGKTTKEKKKGNKNKTFSWNEPSETPAADDFQVEKLEESLQEQVLTEQPSFSLEETAKPLEESSPPVEDSVLPGTEHSLPVDEPSLPVNEPSLPDLESTSLDRQSKTPTEDPTMAPEEANHIVDVPTLSSEEAALADEKTGLPVDENPREPFEPRVAPIEPVEDSPAEVFKSKKNKEKAKISKNFAWDEPAEIPTLDDAEDLSTVQRAENPTVASEEPDVVLPSSVDEAPQESIMKTPKSKKEEKKAKKTKVISWDEPSETAGTDDLEFVSISRSIEDTVVPVEDNEALPKAPAETVDESFHEGPTSKKGKKKGKKGKALEWGELSETPVVEEIQDASAPVVEVQEGAATPTEPMTTPEPNIEATEKSELDDRLAPENANVWPTSEALPTEPIDDFVDADLGKKSKKKGKKYKRMSSEEWGTSNPETPEPWELGMGDIKEVIPTVSSQANDDYLGDSQIDQSKEGNGAGLNVQQMAATLPESPPRSPEDDIPSSKIECFHEALTEPVEPHTVADLPEGTTTQASAVDDSGYPTDTKTIVEPESELQQEAEPELNPQSAFGVKKSKKYKKKAKKAKEIDIELDDAQQDASIRQAVEDPAPAEAPPPSMEPPLTAVPGEASEATTAPLLSRKRSKKDKKRGLHNQSNALDDEIGLVGGESFIESGDAHELPQITEGPKPGNLESIAKDLIDPEPAMNQQAELEVEPEPSFTSKKGKKDKKKSKKLKDVEYDEPMEGKDDPNADDTGQESAAALKEPLAEPSIEPLTEPTDQPGPLSGRASHGLIEIPEQINETSFRVEPKGDTQDFLNAAEEFPAFSSKKKKGKKSKKPQGQQLDLDGPESIEVPATAEDLSRNIQKQEMPQGEIAAVEEQPPVNDKAAEGSLEGSSDPFELSNKPTGIEDQPQVLTEDARLEPLGKRTKKEEKEMKSRKIDETPEPIEPEEVEDLLMKPPGELTEAEHRMISEIPIENDSDIEPQPKDEGTVDIPDVLLKAPEDLTETEREQVSELPQDTEEQIESSINVLDPPTVQTEPSFVEVKQEKAAILEPYPTLFEQGAPELPTIKEGQVLTENNSEGRVPSLDDADRNVSSGASPSNEPMQENTVGLDNTMGDESREKDEFPAFSTTKKSKKGKKSKKERNTQIWEDETATPPAISDENLESDTRNQATRDMSRDVQEPPNLSSPRADLKMEPSNALDEPFRQEVPEETEIIPDDDWLASSGKKSKKSKRSKRRQEQADSCDLSPVSKERVEKPHSTENPHAADTGLKYEDAQDGSAAAASISRDDSVQSEEHRDRLGATMTGLGASAAAAALLSRKDSKKQSKKDKKKKRSSQRMDEQDEDREGFDPDKQALRAMSPIRQEGDPATTDFQSQLHEASDQHLYSKEEPDRLGPSPRSQQSVNRDSGVVVNDSPNIPENPQMHRVVRDSGYQGADDSPVIGYSPEPRDFSMERGEHPDDPLTDVMEPRESRSKRKRRSQRDRDISEDRSASTRDLSASREVIHSRSRRARPFSPTAQSPDLSDQGTYPDLRRHDGLNTERLQTEHLAYDSPREPSPVSSTTKDRSSILFHSSPSNRHDAGIQQEYPLPLSPVQSPVREVSATEATRGRFDRATQLKEDPAEPRSRPISPEIASSPGQNTVPHRSISGGPVSEWRDSISPPQSPISHDRSRLPRLDTITEHSPEESPLHKKSRALSDVGSPERGIKSLRRSRSPKSLSRSRVRSPGTPDNDPSKLVTSNDLDPRLSWPTMDEDRHSIDLERSRSRNTDKRMPSHLSEVSTPIMSLPKQDQRNTSGGSAHSTESINAIIRTPPPDQMRSASGMSYRSSGTPPLRRSDRSVSSDLRLANKKSEAKSLGKRTAADLQDVDNIPSSSTYDPVTDKGKSRVKDMADVYVSTYLAYDIAVVLDWCN